MLKSKTDKECLTVGKFKIRTHTNDGALNLESKQAMISLQEMDAISKSVYEGVSVREGWWKKGCTSR